MNCKPGDLALIVSTAKPEMTGRLVEVLYAAPTEDFVLPDGFRHYACPPGFWVIRSLGNPFPVRGGRKTAMYAAGRDGALKPLPGEAIRMDEMAGDKVEA